MDKPPADEYWLREHYQEIEEKERRKPNPENLLDGIEALETQYEVPRSLISRCKYCNRVREINPVRARRNKRLFMQVTLSHSYTCRRDNCALNHLQNAAEGLCFKAEYSEMCRVSRSAIAPREVANPTQQQDVQQPIRHC